MKSQYKIEIVDMRDIYFQNVESAFAFTIYRLHDFFALFFLIDNILIFFFRSISISFLFIF